MMTMAKNSSFYDRFAQFISTGGIYISFILGILGFVLCVIALFYGLVQHHLGCGWFVAAGLIFAALILVSYNGPYKTISHNTKKIKKLLKDETEK